MALSRLRQLALSRAPLVLRARPLTTSCRSLTRLTNVQGSFVEGDCTPLRSTSLFMVNGIHERSSALKLQIGVRYFSSAETPHTILEMPALSPTMNQGNIAKWRKKEGDKIGVGDVICEIETDKATLEFESLEEGFLAKILVPEGSKDVPVGQPIAITVEDANDIKNAQAIDSGSEAKKQKSPDENGEEAQSTNSAGINLSELPPHTVVEMPALSPTMNQGNLAKWRKKEGEKIEVGDVICEIETDKATLEFESLEEGFLVKILVPEGSKDVHVGQPIAITVIARRLLESKQSTPHLYLSSDVTLDPLLAFRKELKEQHDVKVSVNDIVIKAVAVALKNVPQANAYWNADKGEVILCDSVDISIAVATEKGLMTPIVRNADQKTISAISLEVKELAEKARAGKLAPHEFQGGTFSISNLGMFPVDRFCAIINPPQACILAVGRGNEVVEPVVDANGQEQPAVVTKMSLTLSTDHRVFDGNVGSAFISALKLNFSDIRRLML